MKNNQLEKTQITTSKSMERCFSGAYFSTWRTFAT